MVSTGWIDLVTAKRAKAVDVASPLGSNYLQRSYVFANRALLKVDHINDVTYRYKYKSIQDTADGDMAKRTSAVGRMKDARYDVNGLRERDKNGNRSVEYGMGISTSASAPFEFDEYGNALPGSGSGTGPSSPKTFVGGLSVNDDTADSGLFNMGHRNYAAGVLGRFISRDPIGYAGNLNLYAYPTNPVTFTDAAGLQPALPWPGQQSYPDQSPYAVTGQTKADVLWAIAKIESLRFPDQAKTLRGQLNSGELQLQRRVSQAVWNLGSTCQQNES